MKIELTKNEMCSLMILTWPGSLPIGGVGKILPLGCKNTFRWKNQIGINSNNKKLLKRLKEEKLLGNAVFENSINIIHFYLKNYYIEINGKPIINVFFDEKYLTILTYEQENYVIENFNPKIDVKNFISSYIKNYSENIDDHYLINVSSQEENQKVKVNKYEGKILDFEEQLKAL